MLTALPSAGPDHRDWALLWSLLGHGALLALVLAAGIVLHRAPPVTALAIKATVVDRDALARAAKQAPVKPAPAPSPEPVPEPAPPPPPEVPARDDAAVQKQQAEARAEQAKAEEKARVEKQKAEKLKAEKLKAEQQKAEQQKAEQQKAEQQKAEQQKAAQQKAEQARREKAKADARAAAERKEKAAAEAAQRDMARQLAAEEDLHAAQSSGALDAYVAQIRQRVERNWVKPPSAQPGLNCEVQVTQIPGGTVAGVRIGQCNGDDAVRRSIEAAVLKASPLPLPADPSLFERNLLFTFKPEQ